MNAITGRRWTVINEPPHWRVYRPGSAQISGNWWASFWARVAAEKYARDCNAEDGVPDERFVTRRVKTSGIWLVIDSDRDSPSGLCVGAELDEEQAEAFAKLLNEMQEARDA